MSTKKLCAMGLLVALTCVATMIIQIPIPATQGYVNIGDSIVLISANFLRSSGWFTHNNKCSYCPLWITT